MNVPLIKEATHHSDGCAVWAVIHSSSTPAGVTHSFEVTQSLNLASETLALGDQRKLLISYLLGGGTYGRLTTSSSLRETD